MNKPIYTKWFKSVKPNFVRDKSELNQFKSLLDTRVYRYHKCIYFIGHRFGRNKSSLLQSKLITELVDRKQMNVF